MRHIHAFEVTLVGLVVALVALPGCHRKEAAELAALKASMEATQLNLAKFDDLDFNVFSGQKWDQLSKSHAQNIVVHWPDGQTVQDHHVHLRALEERRDG